MKGHQISHAYDDIIMLEHYVSATRQPMPILDRAAQFAPFAALTGYDAAIRETGRLTEPYRELDESRIAVLDEKLRYLLSRRQERPQVTIRYFRPDGHKSGGAYVSVTGIVKGVDPHGENLLLEDRTAIPIRQIAGIEGTVLEENGRDEI